MVCIPGGLRTAGPNDIAAVRLLAMWLLSHCSQECAALAVLAVVRSALLAACVQANKPNTPTGSSAALRATKLGAWRLISNCCQMNGISGIDT